MNKRYNFVIRLFASLMIGASCAAYTPFSTFRFSIWRLFWFALFGGIGYLLTFRIQRKVHKRLLRYTGTLSFFLALTFTAGAQMQVHDTLYFSLQSLLVFAGFWIFGFLLLSHIFVHGPSLRKTRRPLRHIKNSTLLWSVFLGFCVLSCVWFFSFFPIMTNYDITAHMEQIAFDQYNTHHALIYTLLIRGLLHLASILGFTGTWAFAMLGLLQMIVMGLTFSYGLITMNTAYADRRAVIGAAFYVCVFPIFGYFTFSTTKDTFFACFLLLTAIEIYRLSLKTGFKPQQQAAAGFAHKYIKQQWHMLRILVFATLMCQFRYNGTATVILFAAGSIGLGLFQLCRRKPIAPIVKRLILLLPIILLLSTATSAVLATCTNAETPDTIKRDILSLPLQQMARVLTVTQDPADIARIESLFGVDDIRERYYPYIADPVKAAFLYPDENDWSALRAWAKLSIKYPIIYLEALLDNTRGAWFVDDQSHMKMDYWTSAYGYLEIAQEYAGDHAAYPIQYQSFLPKLQTMLIKTFNDNAYADIPLLRYLFALAVQTWITIITLCYAAYHRRKHATLLAWFAVCVLLPLFLLPCMISRYFLPLFMLNPLCLLALTTHKEKPAA